MIFRLVVLSLTLGLSACISAPPLAPDSPIGHCTALFADIDHNVELAGVRDQGPVLIEGFPFLRANRFLASFAEEPLSGQQFETLVEHLARLDAAAREHELRNLETSKKEILDPVWWERLPECRTLLVQALVNDPTQREKLLAATRVPDDYVTAWRVLGFYPLTAPFVSLGVDRWHEESHAVFSRSLSALPVHGELRRWGSSGASGVTPLWSRTDLLGIPILREDQQEELLRYHAPVWEIDVVDDNDLPGTAVWRGEPAIDMTRATQYETISYTHYGDMVLLQLNYIIWFRARPGDDIYAGQFDGLVWRVTLGPNGEPWLYDSIHNCGCYHTFIPSEHLQLRDDLPTMYFEPPLVPQTAPQAPLVLRVSSGKHYLERVYTLEGEPGTSVAENARTPIETLHVLEYGDLRSVQSRTGYSSFFGKYALLPGSQRAERFILWPMGVRSAGAMRQSGHHPVAFVGRRHFDDARLIESLFVVRER